jgi:aminopeptidase N
MNRYWFGLLAVLYILPVKAQVPGPAIDVQHYDFNIALNDANNSITGKAVVNVLLLKNTSVIPLNLVKKGLTGTGMLVTTVTENGKNLKFEFEGEILKIYTNAKAKTKHSYTINYSGIPIDGLIISTNRYGDRTFFGDNWLKRARYWLPCVDNVADKASVDFTVTAPSHYKVVANGKQLSREEKGAVAITRYSETAPISTKIMVIGVARFAVSNPVLVNDSIAVNAWTYPQDSIAGFKSYAYAAEILPVFIKKLGPFAYKKLANVQSKTVFGGMENAGTIFYYEKSVTANDIESLIAHEIGHQCLAMLLPKKARRMYG